MAFVPLDPRRLADHVGTWLQQPGPEADVVVSCRVRLARNIEGYPFVLRLEPPKAEELSGRMHGLLDGRRIDGETIWVGIDEASPILRLLLRERHLVSRDLAPTEGRQGPRPGRAVAFGEKETVSVMVVEEDHLRLQGMASGLDLGEAHRRVHALDVSLEEEVVFCHNERLGYLTGCPTNVGTGLRASVMLHIPGLGLVRSELEKVFAAAQRTGLAVRGMYGEGSRAVGDYYQISNQVTLGRTEEELIGDLDNLVPSIVAFERRVREALLEDKHKALEDRVRRSHGMLRTARSMPTQTALMHLSNVRLGACLGIVSGIPPADLNVLGVQIQKGHVHVLGGGSLDGTLAEPTERDRQRAAFLRRRFGEWSA